MSQRLPPIPPPVNVSRQPDKATKKGLPDYTGSSADQRVLHINLWFFKYGTDDKTHAAALVLSLILLVTIVIVVFVGMTAPNTEWLDKAFGWLGSAFLFISGIALGGKNGAEKPKLSDEEE